MKDWLKDVVVIVVSGIFALTVVSVRDAGRVVQRDLDWYRQKAEVVKQDIGALERGVLLPPLDRAWKDTVAAWKACGLKLQPISVGKSVGLSQEKKGWTGLQQGWLGIVASHDPVKLYACAAHIQQMGLPMVVLHVKSDPGTGSSVGVIVLGVAETTFGG